MAARITSVQTFVRLIYSDGVAVGLAVPGTVLPFSRETPQELQVMEALHRHHEVICDRVVETGSTRLYDEAKSELGVAPSQHSPPRPKSLTQESLPMKTATDVRNGLASLIKYSIATTGAQPCRLQSCLDDGDRLEVTALGDDGVARTFAIKVEEVKTCCQSAGQLCDKECHDTEPEPAAAATADAEE